MFKLVICALMASVALAQYNPHQQNNYNNQPQYNHQPQQQSYQPQGPKKPVVLANVHYASLGPKLEGDYKYGYEAGDGAFRHEVRNPDGSVSGSYGYVDASGMKRVVKYTAGKHGFSASGDGVPNSADAGGPAPAPQQYAPQYQPAPQQYQAPQQQYQPPPQQYQPPQQQYQPPPQQHYQPPPQQYQPQQSYRPQGQNIQAPSDGTYNPQFNTQGHWDPNRWGAVPYGSGSSQSNHLG